VRPTVTDSQLLLGRLSPDVSLGGRLSLDPGRAADAVRNDVGDPLGLAVDDAAAGIVEVANAAMEGAVRVSLRDRGDDPRDFALVAFGGAGPLHAVELALSLNIGTVIVPEHPGTLCAYGLLHADVRLDFSASELHRSDESGLAEQLSMVFSGLEAQARDRLADEKNLDTSQLTIERTCDIRYPGQAYEVAVPLADGEVTAASLESAAVDFHDRHQRAYSFSDPEDPVEFVTYRVVASVPAEVPETLTPAISGEPRPIGERQVYELGRGFAATPIWDRTHLPVGFELSGPAVIQQTDTTTWLPSYATATIHPTGNMLVIVGLANDEDGA
jgi:N-methylhydantoinase A